MQTLEGQFIARITAFLGRSGLSPTAFGKKALGDPNLMRQIERGRSLTLRSADRVQAFMDEHDGISTEARAPPSRPWYRKPSPRVRRRKTTRRTRAMTEQPSSERANPPIRILRLPEVVERTGARTRGLSHARKVRKPAHATFNVAAGEGVLRPPSDPPAYRAAERSAEGRGRPRPEPRPRCSRG